jgi:hypothetical protein
MKKLKSLSEPSSMEERINESNKALDKALNQKIKSNNRKNKTCLLKRNIHMTITILIALIAVVILISAKYT